MKPWQVAVAGSLCLAVAGCRVNPQTMFLERQNRILEDKVFELQGLVEDLRAGYDPEAIGGGFTSTPAPTPAIRRETDDREADDNDSTGDPLIDGAFDAEFDETPGQRMSPEEFQRRLGSPDKSEPIELPEVPDDRQLDDGQPATGRDAPEPIGPGIEQPGAAPPFRPTSVRSRGMDNSRQVDRLVLDRTFTGGYNADGRPGDEGITVVLQPRDDRGQSLHAAGAVAIVVLDEALLGEEARVARWDFTAAEIARLIKKTGPSMGIALNLRWPGATPINRDLHLFVRYVTADGRNLEAGQTIRIELPDGVSPGWTPTEPQGPELQQGRRHEPRTLPSTPLARVPTSPNPRPIAPQRKPEPKRPVWSPERP